MARSGFWKGSISFGLLNIPVTLQRADKAKDLHFHLLDRKDFSPIRHIKVNAKTGAEVPFERIVKGYQYEPDDYVIVDKTDFTAANPKATQTIDIEGFVSAQEIDLMLFEKPYYLVAQKSGFKGYALLRDALQQTGKVAVGKVVIRTKQHLAAILPRGNLLLCEIMRFPHEVRDPDEIETDEIKGQKKKTEPGYTLKELTMAKQLINGMTERWKPNHYKDTYYEDLMKRIKIKVKQGRGHTVTAPERATKEKSSAEVVDLLPLLRKSLRSTTRRKQGTSR